MPKAKGKVGKRPRDPETAATLEAADTKMDFSELKQLVRVRSQMIALWHTWKNIPVGEWSGNDVGRYKILLEEVESFKTELETRIQTLKDKKILADYIEAWL